MSIASCYIYIGVSNRNQTGTRVIDGARTRNNQIHNLGLYQLSYDHHSGTDRSGLQEALLSSFIIMVNEKITIVTWPRATL